MICNSCRIKTSGNVFHLQLIFVGNTRVSPSRLLQTCFRVRRTQNCRLRAFFILFLYICTDVLCPLEFTIHRHGACWPYVQPVFQKDLCVRRYHNGGSSRLRTSIRPSRRRYFRPFESRETLETHKTQV